MATKAELTDLLARVEAAAGSDRQLDGQLDVLVRHENEAWPPNYTGSLDCALALVERVLPDMCVENLGEMRPGCGPLSGHWLAQLGPRLPRRRMVGPITAEAVRSVLDCNDPVSAETPALALLAALLKALIALAGGEG